MNKKSSKKKKTPEKRSRKRLHDNNPVYEEYGLTAFLNDLCTYDPSEPDIYCDEEMKIC